MGSLQGAAGEPVYVVSRTVTSPVLQASIEKFMDSAQCNTREYMIQSRIQVLAGANQESFGQADVIPSYNFRQSRRHRKFWR